MVNQPYKIDGPCHALIVTLRMVYYCFTNMVISPFGSFFSYSGSNYVNKNRRREHGDIINFWEGTANPPNHSSHSPVILCHTSWKGSAGSKRCWNKKLRVLGLADQEPQGSTERPPEDKCALAGRWVGQDNREMGISATKWRTDFNKYVS